MGLPKRADGVIDGTDWDTVIDAIEARLGSDATGDLLMADTTSIKTGIVDDDLFYIKAVDNDDQSLKIVAGGYGAIDPYFGLGGSAEWKFYNSGTAAFGTLASNWDAGAVEIRAETFESDVATGTAPFTIASTTVVTNLNADLLDGNEASAFPLSTAVVLRDGTQALTADWDAGGFDIRAQTLTADSLTSGRVVFASANGLLIDDADMTFATDTLTVTGLAVGATGADFGGNAVTNVGDAGNDFGATNTLVATTFSGDVEIEHAGALTLTLDSTNSNTKIEFQEGGADRWMLQYSIATNEFAIWEHATSTKKMIFNDGANGITSSEVDFAIADTKALQTGNNDDDYFLIEARDNGDTLVEVGRVQGAADPYIQATLPLVFNPIATASLPATPVEGMVTYDATLNKMVFYNGATWETITSA